MFRVIINLYFFLLYSLVRRATRQKTTGRERRGILFATTDTALTNFEPRTETTPENQDSAESRVEIAPFE